MMRVMNARTISPLLVLSALVLQSCASVQKPDADDNYPGDWAQLAPATAECASLSGRYVNAGAIRDGDGNTKGVPLTSILGISADAKDVSLSVRTRHVDGAGIAYSTLRVAADEGADVRELKDCYCLKQALICRNVIKSSGILGFGGTETSVRFNNATDGSLIGKLQIDRLLTGFGKKKQPWVRFNAER